MQTKLNLYNTLSRSREEFTPLEDGKVGIYVCGITPYAEAHLGHARCYIVFDVLKRFLEYLDYNVFYVQNITDIDDKIINRSQEENLSPEEIAVKYFDTFQKSMSKLNVRPADLYPKVSESITDIIEFVQKLIQNGSAYEQEGSVYFRIGTYEKYGSLSGRNIEELLVSRQCSLESSKENIRDFAVWKADLEYGWESPWGKGRPGWHIECSAMSRKYLGDVFDIHGGGLDLIFPHHENEVAQSYALTRKDPVRFWVHNGMVNLKGDKMSKSTGNFFRLDDIINKYSPMSLRLYLLSTSYRQVLDFNFQSLEETQKAYYKLVEFKKEILQHAPENVVLEKKLLENIVNFMKDDLNTARTIGEIFKNINPIKTRLFEGNFTEEDITLGSALVNFVENILGISLQEELTIDESKIEELIEERMNCRKLKDFSGADRIRDELAAMGIELKDTPTGTHWSRK